MIGRVLRTGLSSLRDRAGSRFNPSRIDPAHEFEPFCIIGVIKDERGDVLGWSTRRGRLCRLCGVTDVIGDLPCVPGKYFSK